MSASFRFKSKLDYLKLLGWLAIPTVLWILPADHFDEGQSISIFALIGIADEPYIYSTGMTRAVMHLMHFDFEGAAHYNKLSFIVLPFLFLVWLKYVLAIFGIKILKFL